METLLVFHLVQIHPVRRRRFAVEDAVLLERHLAACRQRDQFVLVLVHLDADETFPELMKMDYYLVLPLDEEYPCLAQMRMGCCQVSEFQ